MARVDDPEGGACRIRLRKAFASRHRDRRTDATCNCAARGRQASRGRRLFASSVEKRFHSAFPPIGRHGFGRRTIKGWARARPARRRQGPARSRARGGVHDIGGAAELAVRWWGGGGVRRTASISPLATRLKTPKNTKHRASIADQHRFPGPPGVLWELFAGLSTAGGRRRNADLVFSSQAATGSQCTKTTLEPSRRGGTVVIQLISMRRAVVGPKTYPQQIVSAARRLPARPSPLLDAGGCEKKAASFPDEPARGGASDDAHQFLVDCGGALECGRRLRATSFCGHRCGRSTGLLCQRSRNAVCPSPETVTFRGCVRYGY